MDMPQHDRPLTSAPPPQGDWSIELLRGLAALLVVMAHYLPTAVADPGLLRFAFTGVDLFFVISGYVFAPYLFGKGLLVRAYLVRRLFRIYPLYVVALATYAVLRWTQGQDLAHLGKHLLLLHTLESRGIAFQFNPAFWSLPPEAEYYLALPLLAALCGTLRRTLVMSLLALVSHAVIAFLSPTDVVGAGLAWLLGFHLPALLVEFMLGTLAWWVVRQRPGSGVRVAMLALGFLAWGLIASRFVALGDAGVLQNHWWRGNVGLLAAAAYALMVAGWADWVPRPAAWLLALATLIGDLSYGLYLFHNAAPVALAPLKSSVGAAGFAVICFLATAVLAQVLHIIWEAPWRRYGRGVAREIEAAADLTTPQVTDR